MHTRKLKPPDAKNHLHKHFITTTKTSLDSILDDFDCINNNMSKQEKFNRIQDAVFRVNNIVFHTTHFLELYLLHLFHNNLQFPDLTLDFIGLCMRTVSFKHKNYGAKPSETTTNTLTDLKKFFNEHYIPLLGPEPNKQIVDIYHLAYILQYEEIDILKNINNNISMHFIDYCLEFVNKYFQLKENIKLIDNNNNLTLQQKISSKRNLSIQLRLVKQDLLSPLNTPYKSDSKYHNWLNDIKPNLITKSVFNEDTPKNHINYDIKANTLDYLRSMIYVVDKLKNYSRNIQCIPLRSSFTPKYITIDTASLIMLMIDKKSIDYLKNMREYRDQIWCSFFNLERKLFYRKDYNFFHMIKTDGVGVSVIMYRSDLNRDFLPKETEIEKNSKEYYVGEVVVKGYNKVVGIDPGKEDLLHCTDGTNFFRYTANQRRMETRKKIYIKINENQKLETKIEELDIVEWETILSKERRCTTDLEAFKNYLKVKLPLYYKLQEYYYDETRRKLRWNSYINTQRSEANMINNFRRKFGDGDKTIIAIGDYDQGSYHLKGKEPIKGKGFRKILRRAGYQVLLVDEFRTSCKCHNCYGDAETFLYRENHKPVKNPETYQEIVKVNGLLRCKSVNECGSLWNRDVNGCLNIRMLACEILEGREIPEEFQRKTV